MQDKYTFEYATIRIVPRVEREEFFNVGVIVFSKKKKYLGIKVHICPDKLAAFNADLDLAQYQAYLNAWELVCEGTAAAGRIGAMELSDRFRWLTACRSTVIQSSKTHPGLCEDPEQMLAEIFAKNVL
ncbi:DUF3037 domain-containing protein [Dokdonia sp. Hel_I_53]|uniref:DUF3037 domain-containing protein n=1 Tax=Dokdonia sp. Hel_I_53 TaxID=1566287 RepID=UPI00119C19DC|nr:DUF3037 domain-containing protein [Dokdonia sp. Hel_I_53]TVZ51517.1 Protein of unknown function (DUF3037) [Dokdonia sp. Hel_I_53]